MATAVQRRRAPEAHLSLPKNGLTVTMGGILSVLGILGAIYGFYYSTQSTLTAHSTQIEKLSAKADSVQKEINDNDKATQSKLSDLHEQSTVANNNQKVMGDQLDKIVNQLNALSLASAPARR